MQVQLTATDLETALEAVMTIGQPTAKKKKDSETEDIVPGSGIRMTSTIYRCHLISSLLS